MSIFQVICIVVIAVEAVIFVLHIFLDVQCSNAADTILYIFVYIATSIGLVALIAGAVGHIIV